MQGNFIRVGGKYKWISNPYYYKSFAIFRFDGQIFYLKKEHDKEKP